jgi:hypothetical protein
VERAFLTLVILSALTTLLAAALAGVLLLLVRTLAATLLAATLVTRVLLLLTGLILPTLLLAALAALPVLLAALLVLILTHAFTPRGTIPAHDQPPSAPNVSRATALAQHFRSRRRSLVVGRFLAASRDALGPRMCGGRPTEVDRP